MSAIASVPQALDVPRAPDPVALRGASEDLPAAVAALFQDLAAAAPRALTGAPGCTLLNDLLAPRLVGLADPEHDAAWAALPHEPEDRREPVALFAVHDLTIPPGARLRLDGPPTIVLAERLTIAEGGVLEVLVRARLFVGTLRKLER